MNIKFWVSVVAVILGSLGVGLTFFPQEIAIAFQLPVTYSILFQLIGAAYFALSMTNWMSRASLLGGIYGRAIVIGNFAHFMISGMALIKLQLGESAIFFLWPLTIIFLLFGALYGYLLFNSPKQVSG